jgi:quercetin dioxygenase-like cupin family protein
MSSIPQVLNLINLAKGSSSASNVPGTQLEVLVIQKTQELNLKHDLWLLVLEGELIIDLPFGDFRVLKNGDSLHVPAATTIKFQPVEDTTILWQNGSQKSEVSSQ